MALSYKELYEIRKNWVRDHIPYEMCYWKNYNMEHFHNIMYKRKNGRGDNSSYNDVIIMADTETSKSLLHSDQVNHVVAWTISVRAFDRNICTLWGRKPSEFCLCVKEMLQEMSGEKTIIYFHNLSYDYYFLRQFIFTYFGKPMKQLATKSHYPIYLEFIDGLIIKDSLILSQRSLEKWADDLSVEHQKAVGKWDYNKYRTQNDFYTSDELEYIEHDTLAGVECLDALRKQLNKEVYTMPYTATGIPRYDIRMLGKENHAKQWFNSMCMNYEQQEIAEMVYHGGYTHSNRHLIDCVLCSDMIGEPEAYDFASSYPYALMQKLPAERFFEIDDCDYHYILENMEDYAFMFKLILVHPKLKDDNIPMPALQFSKCVNTINAVIDNGRIIEAEYAVIWLTEYDLDIIMKQYDFDAHICKNVYTAAKDYLPRWITDYIFSLFTDKTMLKGGDPVAYALAKSKLNSIYGMFVQKPIKDNIIEDYNTGEYYIEKVDREEKYDKYLKNHNSILPYQIGVWVTAIAFHNLFKLGSCCETWVYSDTDSCYGIGWDKEKLNQYNENVKSFLTERGYGAVHFNGKDYWLGVAEFDGSYSEFVTQGAKRYCGRDKSTGKLKITVAGVPKKNGVKCLNDNINLFTRGLIFDGKVTGKLTHHYIPSLEGIYIDEYGNECADSIDLTPCDYLLDSVNIVHIDDIEYEDIEMQIYDESEVI